MADDPEDEGVGYGRPPKHTRWQKGQSGNPRGRPKGSRGLRTDLHAELVSRMTIQINGRPVTATKQQLMIKTLTARAAAGDVRAISKLIDLVMQVFGPEDRSSGPARLSPRDEALLRDALGGSPNGDAGDEPDGDEIGPGDSDTEDSEEDPDA